MASTRNALEVNQLVSIPHPELDATRIVGRVVTFSLDRSQITVRSGNVTHRVPRAEVKVENDRAITNSQRE